MAPIYRNKKGSGPAPTLWVDIDDTVINFSDAHPAGVRAVERWARAHATPGKALKVASLFDRAFQAGLNGWHSGAPSPDLEKLRARIAPRLARITSDGPRPVRWAREIWLELAAEDAGLKLPPATICEGTREYWQALGPAQKMYPGAVETLVEMRARGYEVVLVTSSDCRMVPGDAGWRYDLEQALEWKLRRIRGILSPLVPEVARLYVGDPYEKSTPDFFRHVLAAVPPPGGGFVIAVGDSVESDLRLARAADPCVRYGILCDPQGHYAGSEPDGVDRRIGQLSELLYLFF